MFGFIKNQLKKIYETISSRTSSLFSRTVIDENALKELEKILIEADTGIRTTRNIIEQLKKAVDAGKINQGLDLKLELQKQLINLLATKKYDYDADIFLLVGINGSGKTTFAGKLGYQLSTNSNALRNKLLFVAADTFRAAATQQLIVWAEKCNAEIVVGQENQDPSSVIYQGCKKYLEGNFDKLIIDTAGRLQTKANLMKELEKIKRTIEKLLPSNSLRNKKISTLLTIDSMLGQNSLVQARVFFESTNVDGLVLTKIDGTGKGGIIFAITQELKIPVAYLSYGEQIDQLSQFDAENYVKDLLNS